MDALLPSHQWAASVNWERLPALFFQNTAESQLELEPLIQSALDVLGIPTAEVCGSTASACAAGLFALQVSALSGLVRAGRVQAKDVAGTVEPAAASFARAFGAKLVGKRTLVEDFGVDLVDPPPLHQIALQFLFRLLWVLSGLPPPEGPVEGLSSEDPSNCSGDKPGDTASGRQFAFGKNWQQFVQKGRITAKGLLSAVREVRRAIGGAVAGVGGLRVLDLGCGSGLSSLAFRLLGAQVLSADVQSQAVEATRRLQEVFSPAGEADQSWRQTTASALDARRLGALGPVDVVYSWGVLHHTGDVWQALHNAQLPLADDGLLLVAIYAEEFYDEKDNLLLLKQEYRKSNAIKQEHLEIILGIHWLRPLMAVGQSPVELMRNFSDMRGMDFWTDARDWLGGWPMEFVNAGDVISFARRSGLRCVNVRRYGGNTEFSLVRPGAGLARWTAGRICEPLEGFQEVTAGEFYLVQDVFYRRSEDLPRRRRWWRSPLSQRLAADADRHAEPQRDRLLLVTADDECFGYPSAQFARPDSVEDLRLPMFAFWEGYAYASPGLADGTSEFPMSTDGGTTPSTALTGIRACLLPTAELSSEEVAEVSTWAARRGL